AEFGISVLNDIIIDPRGYNNNYEQPIVDTYAEHEITNDLVYGSVYFGARSIELSEQEAGATYWTWLAKTGETSWGETNLADLKNTPPEFDEGGDNTGPLIIAATAEISNSQENQTDDSISQSKENLKKDIIEPETKNARLAVFGDSDWINNLYFLTLGNHALALNTIHWLAEEYDLIAIPPNDPSYDRIELSSSAISSAFYIPVLLIPLMLSVIGFVRIHDRRKRG
ncbi:hypothetical protein JW979_05885, partial [bacterium]|nr:hypothetical protein [candidate division CSSED10-310 bacterium]